MTIIGGHKAAVAILMLAAATLSTRGGESWAAIETVSSVGTGTCSESTGSAGLKQLS